MGGGGNTWSGGAVGETFGVATQTLDGCDERDVRDHSLSSDLQKRTKDTDTGT